jgi:hypothetical protein
MLFGIVRCIEMAKGRFTGGGSRAGVPNKITRDLKEMILGALDGAGGVDYLIEQSQKNPAAFLTLVGKVLPLQMTGANEGPVIIITGVARTEDQSC